MACYNLMALDEKNYIQLSNRYSCQKMKKSLLEGNEGCMFPNWTLCLRDLMSLLYSINLVEDNQHFLFLHVYPRLHHDCRLGSQTENVLKMGKVEVDLRVCGFPAIMQRIQKNTKRKTGCTAMYRQYVWEQSYQQQTPAMVLRKNSNIFEKFTLYFALEIPALRHKPR